MADLRVGLIGLGTMGRNHARILASLDGVEFAGIAEPTGAAPGAAPPGVPVVESVEKLLAIGLDYATIATPTRLHRHTALRLAQAGVPALIEKPLAADLASATEIAREFRDAGLVGAIGHIERYSPALRQAKTRVTNGDLGEVYQVSTRRQGPFPGRIADVGVILDLATHDFDLTAWVTQQSFVSVTANVAHRSGSKHEDLLAMTGRLSSGTVTSHLVNWLSPMKERVTVITGEKGTLIADTLTADLTLFENGTVPTEWTEVARFRGVTEGDMRRFAYPKREPLRTEHEQFRDAVMGKDADIVSLGQAVVTMAVADAALRSADIGQEMPITAMEVAAA